MSNVFLLSGKPRTSNVFLLLGNPRTSNVCLWLGMPWDVKKGFISWKSEIRQRSFHRLKIDETLSVFFFAR